VVLNGSLNASRRIRMRPKCGSDHARVGRLSDVLGAHVAARQITGGYATRASLPEHADIPA
jgi:hypothetical protein